jgi:hypothetical protein
MKSIISNLTTSVTIQGHKYFVGDRFSRDVVTWQITVITDKHIEYMVVIHPDFKQLNTRHKSGMAGIITWLDVTPCK